jgi:hypothetical protein
MTLEQVANAMMQRYGFFVVCSHVKRDLGVIRVGARTGDAAKRVKGRINAPYVLIAEASLDDYRLQCELAGVPLKDWGDYKYRAVAE